MWVLENCPRLQPASMESNSTQAVFLSYAREDTAAALRIAEALRSHGIDVWFDQSELRVGDGWDQKIRRQIKECAIFIALISERTEQRHEGYFRLEWKLAVERTHLMVAGAPFLLPVVVDGTSESTGMVPDEFLRVQWTRLPGSLPTPQFIVQVRGLLDSQRRPAVQGRGSGAFTTPAAPGIPRRPPGPPAWAWAALGVAAPWPAGWGWARTWDGGGWRRRCGLPEPQNGARPGGRGWGGCAGRGGQVDR